MTDDDEAAARLRHELRTPINHILGYAELLIEDADDRGLAPRIAPLASIRDRGKKLLNLVTRMTAPAAGGDGHAEVARQLPALLGEIVAQCDLLERASEGEDREELARDLGKIRAACERLGILAGAVAGG